MAAAAPDDQFVLAVDLGTGGPKVGLVSITGATAWQDHVPVSTHRDEDGTATQDAGEWWRLIVATAQRALASGTIRADQVVAVSCTGQWASTVPVDDAGTPVGDCVLWQDTRGGRYSRGIFGGRVAGYDPKAAATWIRRTGGVPSPTGKDPIGHMLLLAAEHPDVAKAARWYLEPVDYLSMRFTGVAAATHGSMTAAWLTDNRRLTDLRYDDDLVRRSGVDATKLPPLVAPGSVIGTVRPEVAAELGLPDGVRVVPGTLDLHSAAAGAGTVLDFEAHLAVSTSAWIGLPVPFKRTDVLRSIASVPGLSAHGYLVANNHETGGLCLQWLRDSVLCDARDFDALTAAAAEVSPGSNDIIFTPWLNGERSPVDDQHARGGFHNLSLRTTGDAMVRAVLEGVAYNNRWLHEAVEKFARRRLDPIRMIGGGATSELWCQIHADVMDRTIERVAEPLHANLRGAAILAGLALGAIRPADVRALVPIAGTFRPDPANRETYDRLYDEFPKLYKAQKPMFGRLNRRRRR